VVRIGELPLKLEVAVYYNGYGRSPAKTLGSCMLTFVFTEQHARPVLMKGP
jgi:hypothetical protein